MTRLGLRPYRDGDDPPPRSVAVSVVVLTRNEEVNIAPSLASVAWADQVMAVDSGSADDTVPIARSLGADVMEQPWLGFSGQREFALRLPELRHDLGYFVDADEVALRFADGSLTVIAYGSAEQVVDKEWIEIQAASHRVVIDDFRSAEVDGKTAWKGRQDKGTARARPRSALPWQVRLASRPRPWWPRWAPRSVPPGDRAVMTEQALAHTEEVRQLSPASPGRTW